MVFNNASSTLLSPQTITWTSTVAGNYARIEVNSGCFVQLLTDVTLPPNRDGSDIISGTLICGSHVLKCNTTFSLFPFQLNGGAFLYTANPGGVDSTVLCTDYVLDPSSNYVFNGSVHQATGILMPSLFNSGGSVTVNNSAGVTLSQSTTFGDGSTLALTNGNLTIGASELNLGAAASLTGPFSSTSMVITNGTGMLQKQFGSNGSFLYPVGDNASNYSPISMSITGSEYAEGAYLGAKVTHAKHPNNHNATNFISRFWSVTTVDVSDPSYTIDSAKYVPGDVTGTEANISMGQYTGSLPWTKFGPANTVAHTLSSPAVTNNSSDFTGISTALPTVDITPSSGLCFGDSMTLSVISIGTDTPFTYAWSPATGLSSTTGSSVTTGTTSNITYTLTVTDANGFTATDTTAITVNVKPDADAVTGGGTYCSGTGGVHVGLNTSDSGILYQLFLNTTTAIGTPFAGTDSAIDFGSETAAGTYTVIGTNATTGCFSHMTDSAVVVVNLSPVIDTVTGGGSFCFGGAGVHIGLNSSTGGITYQLYNGVATVDTAVTGTGSSLDFGAYTVAGAYTVVATNTLNSCTNNMADSAHVVVNPLPAIFAVTGGGNYCAGTGGRHIGLSGSDTGIHYQLYLSGTTAIGAAIAGTGSAIDFGSDTLAGVYTVVATNTVTGCNRNMSGGTAITIIPVVIPTVTIEPSIADTICEGTTVTFFADAVNAGGEPSYQWRRNDTVVGTNSPDYSYVPVNGNVLTVRLISDAVCAIPDTVTDTMAIFVQSHRVPVVTLSVSPNDTVCEGTTVVINATPTFGGHAPSYAWVKNMIVVSTDSFYSYVPTNLDNIYCVMESDYFCLATTTAYSNVIDMRVEAPVVPSVSFIVSGGTVIGVGKPDTLTAVVLNGGPNPSYQWYLNSALVFGATNATYSRSSFSEHDSVSCKVTRNDACGFSTFTSAVISVSKLDVKQAASAGSDIKLVPNPNRGTFTITGSLGASTGMDEEVSIEITDMLGQVVYKTNTISQNGNISELIQMKNTLANGIYLLNLRSGSGNNAIRFVIGQ